MVQPKPLAGILGSPRLRWSQQLPPDWPQREHRLKNRASRMGHLPRSIQSHRG